MSNDFVTVTLSNKIIRNGTPCRLSSWLILRINESFVAKAIFKTFQIELHISLINRPHSSSVYKSHPQREKHSR